MKTNISQTIIPTLVAALALASSAFANPPVAGSYVPIVTLAPTGSVPDPSTPEIQIPVEFARFGAYPHPGAAFAPYYTIEYVPSRAPVALQNPGHSR